MRIKTFKKHFPVAYFFLVTYLCFIYFGIYVYIFCLATGIIGGFIKIILPFSYLLGLRLKNNSQASDWLKWRLVNQSDIEDLKIVTNFSLMILGTGLGCFNHANRLRSSMFGHYMYLLKVRLYDKFRSFIPH